MQDRAEPITSSLGYEDVLNMAVTAAKQAAPDLQTLLETFSAPIYVTDADGWVTAFNSACVNFAGRIPIPGKDSWCVTWRLHGVDGESLAHDACPMAVAIREKRQVRGLVAVAERPDGSRVTFAPYPTPILDAAGELIGAVNMLIDVTDARQADALRTQARRCRRLAQSVTDRRTIETLRAMAREYDEEAERLGAALREISPSPVPFLAE